MRLLADPMLRLDELVTHRFPLTHYDRALDLARRGHDESLKIAFTCGTEIDPRGERS